MADDFLETAQRMMHDAKALQAAGAHRNACYLAGYVVECTLKTMLEVAGENPWGHEIDGLNELLLRLRLAPADKIGQYGDPSVLAPMIFTQLRRVPVRKRNGTTALQDQCHWDPQHRYDGTRWVDAATSRQYIDEAQKFADIIDDLKYVFFGVL